MGLFKRKAILEDDAVRCPGCAERVPDGAAQCAMCGRDLADVTADGRGAEDRFEKSAEGLR